jgi:large subunit ribosomal protein L29
MAKAKKTDWRALEAKEIEKKISELKGDLLAAKKSLADAALPNPRVIRVMRREIARAKTVLREKNVDAPAKAANDEAAKKAESKKKEVKNA